MKKTAFIVSPNVAITRKNIIASLEYLRTVCPYVELLPCIEIAIELCHSATLLDEPKWDDSTLQEHLCSNSEQASFDSFLVSLEYLAIEATRNKFEDIDIVLDATFKFCMVMHCIQVKKNASRLVSGLPIN
jgi:hypothetical protein